MIRSLRLRNFKCFEDQSFLLSRLTLLAGLNGMGKSTLLQSLLLLRQSHQQGILRSYGLALNGALATIGTAADALYEGAKAEEIGFEVVNDDGVRGDWRFSYDRQADVLALTSDPVPAEVWTSAVFGDDCQYLRAERLGPRTSFEMSDYQVRRHRQLGSSGEYTAHFLSVFANEPVLALSLHHPQAISAALKDQAEAWVGEVSPGTRLNLTTHPGVDLVTLQYSFVRGDQLTNSYRATNVGFGLTHALPVIVAVLSARPNSLLLIENPESSLHPRGQARIGELLALATLGGVQVVVETHSDHVLNGIRSVVHDGVLEPDQVQIHFFERVSDMTRAPVTVTSPRLDRNGRIDEWPPDFFDQWDRSLESLLEPRRD